MHTVRRCKKYNIWGLAMVLGLTLSFSSCSLLGTPDEDIDRFLLKAYTPANAQMSSRPHHPVTMIVDSPMVYAPLDNTRVALKPTDHTIDYIADIEWSDRLGSLIHDSTIQSLQNAHVFKAVGRLNGGLNAAYLLDMDVRAFNKRCCNNTVEAEYIVNVLDMGSRQPIASKRFSARVPMHPDNEAASAVALSLSQAHSTIMQDMITWLRGLSLHAK